MKVLLNKLGFLTLNSVQRTTYPDAAREEQPRTLILFLSSLLVHE